jgi:hypothetical protein
MPSLWQAEADGTVTSPSLVVMGGPSAARLGAMPRREDDDVAQRPGVPGPRPLLLAGGFALAAAATLAVFLTDNPQYLRVAVVAVAWAFVLATFAAGRRGTDRVAAAARERELRRSYERELEREVAARHEYELEIENEVRRETEDAMRYELDALRGDIAALSGLRDEVARVSALREDIAGLTSLRDEVARVAALRDEVAGVAALRDDVAALRSLREDLGQLTELRADMGRLRAELTEQLSSEMFIERIIMRTQASRLPSDQSRLETSGRVLDGGSAWTDDVPPRELTGGWPAIRLDEPRETRQFEQVRMERTGPRPPVPAPEAPRAWEQAADHRPATARPATAPPATAWDATPPMPAPPVTATFAAAAVASPPPAFTPPPVPATGDRWSALTDPSFAQPQPQPSAHRPDDSAHSRHAAAEQAPPTSTFPLAAPRAPEPEPVWRATPPPPPPTAVTPIAAPPVTPPAEPPPSPLEWLAAHSLLDPPPALRPEVPPRRRRTDDDLDARPEPAPAATGQRPRVPAGQPPVRIDDRGGYRVAVRDAAPPAAPPPSRSEPTTQGTRVAEILAENGVTPAPGGRRRRRYRDEDDTDDVLSRVLRQN